MIHEGRWWICPALEGVHVNCTFQWGEKELLSISRFYLEIILYRWLCYQLFSLFCPSVQALREAYSRRSGHAYCKLKSGMHGILSRRSVSNSRGAGDSRRRERKREIARQRERERKRGLRDNFPNRIFVLAMREVDFFSGDDWRLFSFKSRPGICHVKCDWGRFVITFM